MTNSTDDLHGWVRHGRGDQTDWYDEHTPPSTLASTLTAMANGQGGKLLLGIVGPGGSIVGVRNISNTVDRVLQAALSTDPPLVIPLPEVIRVNGKAIIIARVPEGLPHVYAHEGHYLRRDGVQNIPFKARDLRQLILQRGEVSFESERTPRVTLDDLDMERVRAYAAALSLSGETSIEQLLLRRGCLVDIDGQRYPTNAGILLFGKDPQRFLRGADITAVRFASATMTDSFSRQDIGGTLPDQIRRAEVFLRDHLRKEVVIGQTMARGEQTEYPLEAVRELLVNAVAHRDYQIQGDGIRLFIFSNRLEITSPGDLPGPVTVANIKDERFSRNPAIVQMLSDMGFIERLGYGVDRVIDLMRHQGLRPPEFTEKAGGFRVVLHNQITDVTPPEPEPAPPARLDLSQQFAGVELNPRQEVAITFLVEGSSNQRITNSDLQRLCPDVHPETIRRDLADLVNKNLLKKMGQKRGSYYILNRQES
jgi:ATP-dependent DNA helicase RecG